MRNLWTVFVLLPLVACGDPLADFERIENVELAADAPVASALSDADDVAPTVGLFARLLNRGPVAADVADGALETNYNISAPIENAVAAVVDVPNQGAVAGWLRRSAAVNAKPRIGGAVETPNVDVITEHPSVVVKQDGQATAEVVKEPVADLVEPKKRRGLFADTARKETRNGPDSRDVPFGTALPYGEVARVCDAKNKGLLGRRLDQAPAPGRGYSLYDSAPQSAHARTFYVTGFKDNCPRQFTAALALFGSPETHEQLRYGLPSKSHPYSSTDKAYEKVKSIVCKVGKNKPCGSKMIKLQRNTVFISTYEKYSDNARWADILLHDGAVVAAALKTP